MTSMLRPRAWPAIAAFALFGLILAPGVAGAQAPCRYDAAQPSVKLSGTIKDSSGGGVGGATVALECGNFRRETRTLADGTYQLSVPAGSYLLNAQAPGFELAIETIELSKTAANRRDLTLQLGRFESIVTVSAPAGFVATSSTTATKTDAPLIEIPQTVSVVTLAQMEARSVQTVNQAVEYSGGVSVDSYGQETRYDWLYIRGFNQSSYGLFRDNSRWQGGALSGQIDPYMLQEVDVIKGPSSVLFGQNTPGGLVNLVTKRPPAATLNEVMFTVGSYNRTQAQADLGGPIDKDGHFRYRLTFLARKSDTQVDYVPDNRTLVAPAITWSPSAKTTLTVLGDYQHDKTGWSQFLPSQGTFVPNPNGTIPRSFFTGEPNYDYFNRDQSSIGSLFEHRFNNTWTVRNTFRRSTISSDGKTAFGGGLAADNRTLARYGYSYPFDMTLYTTDTNASARFKTGNVEHSILFGFDYSWSETTIKAGFALAPSIDVFKPVYGATIPDLFIYQNTDQTQWLAGQYVQDHMKVGKSFVLTAAGRHDSTHMTTKDLNAKTTVEQDPGSTSGRVGATYLSAIGLAPYVSYSTSFLPTAGVDFKGKPYEPTTSAQVEGGVKYQPKGVNALITASVFNITQQKVQVPDPTNVLNQLQEGEVRARGFELEGVGSIAKGLDVRLAYTYLDQKVTKTTDPATLDKRPPLVPDRSFAASVDYTYVFNSSSTIGFNFGGRYVGTTAGDATNTIEVPAYTLLDASVRYDWKAIEFGVTASNLTDRSYVAVCTSPSYCNYGGRRQILSSVRFRWNKW